MVDDRMDQRERLLRTLDREEVDRAPCASPLQTGIVDLMRLCGAHWPAANDDPLLMTELALAAHRYAGLEAVRVPFDVTVDASAFGAVTDRGASDRQPAVLGPLLKGPDDRIEALPDPVLDGRAPVLLSSVEMLAKRGNRPGHLRFGRPVHARLPAARARGRAVRYRP